MTVISNSNYHNYRNLANILHDLGLTDLAEVTALINEMRIDHATFKTVVDDLKTLANALRSYVSDGVQALATIAIDGHPEKFQTTTTCAYRIAGVTYTKVATGDLVFSAANTINVGTAAGTYWGVWLVEIGVDGNVHTKPGGGLVDQVYTSEALAIAALPAVTASHVQIGYITVNSKNGASWTANTDDMTNGSDCTTTTFYNLPAPATLPAAVATSSPATLTAPAVTPDTVDE
jgi:hypothetical protein